MSEGQQQSIPDGKTSVLVAHTTQLGCNGLRVLLEEDNLAVVATVSSDEEAVRVAIEQVPDIILFDLDLLKACGFEVIQKIRAEGLQSTILVLALPTSEPQFFFASLAAGADGYLSKNISFCELVRCIRLAHETGIFMVEKVVADRAWALVADFVGDALALLLQGSGLQAHYHLVNTRAKVRESRHGELGHREIEVLDLVAQGMENKEIAATLSISEHTVQAHLSNIFSKLRVSSRTGAVSEAVKRGLINLTMLDFKRGLPN